MRFVVLRDGDEIVITPSGSTEIFDKEQDFIMDTENSLVVLRDLYKDSSPTKYEKYFIQLLKIVQVGLGGDNPHLDLSKRALKQMKTEILNIEGSAIKNKYLKEFGEITLWYCAMFILLFFVSRTMYQSLSPFFILMASSSTGVWLSVTLSKSNLDFEDLNTIHNSQLVPNLKLIFTNLVTVIFGLLFFKGIITFEIGDISTKDIFNDNASAIIFGVVLGLNERVLGNSLINNTKKYFKI